MPFRPRYTGLIERYSDRLPVTEDTKLISLGEGNTPLLKLNNIPENPFMYRKREKMDDDTREVIFKGYTIPLYIDKEQKKIFILGIFNQNLWE